MIITQTPLRISLAGGGTDFPDYYELSGEGRVLTTAIEKFVYVILKERCDDLIIVNYSEREEADSVDQIRHELVREAMRMTGVEKGIEIHTLSDIRSEGSGLGSSSSFTVGILNALYLFQGIQAPPAKLAEEACEIEIDICGKPIGRQDQYIAAYGGLRLFAFLPTIPTGVRLVPTDISEEVRRRLAEHLMLFYLGMPRESNGLLTEQRLNIPEKMGELNCLCVYAATTAAALEKGTVAFVGGMLADTWKIKQSLAEGITNERIDLIYERAILAGAVGGKVCGAGGGGHLVLYVEPGRQESVREALPDLQEVPIRLERDGSKVIFNSGQP